MKRTNARQVCRACHFGSPAQRPGFSPKIFFDYFNRDEISGQDVEVAIELQYWIRGFAGSEEKDYIQFLAHMPFGYRSQDDATGTEKGWSMGTINTNIEHFLTPLKTDDAVWYFDNGISVAFPTAAGKQSTKIGGNFFAVNWFQENFIKNHYCPVKLGIARTGRI